MGFQNSGRIVSKLGQCVKCHLSAHSLIPFLKGYEQFNGLLICYFFQDDHATALHMVAVFGFDSIASLLIEHGGDLNVKTQNEHTPLHR